MNPREYRPEVDGLRAVAVIPVVLFHWSPEWLRGGFLGVDVFFVISGFLITSIVLDDLRCGSFTLQAFWERRVRRILPALVAMVGSTLIAGFVLTPAFDHAALGNQAVAALLSVANLYYWRMSGDYWGQTAEQMPLLHTWSLSVEEQFYLVFPLAVLLIHRRRPAFIPGVILLAIAISLGLFLLGMYRGFIGTFYLLPARAWELAAGGLLATVPQPEFDRCVRRGGEWLPWLAVIGLGMILASYRLVSRMSGSVVLLVVGTVLVLAFSRRGPCGAILSSPPLVYVGKASYSLYLWHWPCLVLAAHPNLQMDAWAAFGVSCFAAVLSYEFIEKYTRRRPGILAAIGFSYLAVLVAAVAMAFSNGEYDTAGFSRPGSHAYVYDLGDVSHDGYRAALARAGKTHDLAVPSFAGDAYREGGVIVGPEARPQVVVIGDSHGATWSHAIRGVTEKLGLTASFYSAMGISPFAILPPEPSQSADRSFSAEAFQRARLKFIASWRPEIVIVGARWSRYEWEDVVGLIRFLDENAGCTLLLEQPPELAITDRSPMQWLAFKKLVPEDGRKVWLPQGNLKRYERGRRLVRRLVEEFPRCEVVPVADLYADDYRVLVLDGRNLLYLDDDHLTDIGSEVAAGRIENAIAKASRVRGEEQPTSATVP